MHTMASKKVRITSKNQITLPIEFVRKLKLEKNRTVTITEKNGQLTLEPEPSIRQQMQKQWDSLPPFKGTKSEEELKQAKLDAWKQVAEESGQ